MLQFQTLSGRLIAYAHALVQKYGEGTAELACQMYDATAKASGVSVPPAEPAAPAGYRETARMVKATQQNPVQLLRGVSRLVKQAGADTTLKNGIRDGAEWAWIPHGDACAFCLVLASRGWERASKKALKGGHAQHIHANCNCEYAIRFDSSTTVAGYDPDEYLKQYEEAGGDINAMRREHYAQHKDEINTQKRAAYAARHSRKEDIDIRSMRKKMNKSDTGRSESGIIKNKDQKPVFKGFTAKNLSAHFEKHRKEYPGKSPTEYAEYALKLVQSEISEDIAGYTAKDGAVVRYRSSTNDFVKAYPETGIATLFKPKTGLQYFEKQKKKEMK